jgi:hypothetical protein|tara:strand:+ start:19460 stop:19825 length:366 start_codon:yes stop_codon:yes gene_type:complete
MAAVNIVNVTSIQGFNMCGAVTTSATDVIDVPADVIYKINTVIISNVDGTNSANITASVSRDNGSNYFHIAKTVAVPADSTLVLIDKNSGIYLDETDLLRLTASANSDLEYVISGEILGDA